MLYGSTSLEVPVCSDEEDLGIDGLQVKGVADESSAVFSVSGLLVDCLSSSPLSCWRFAEAPVSFS